MPDQEDRSEAATPRRLQRAREEGQVALSREAAPLAVLGAAALVLALQAPAGATALGGRLAAILDGAALIAPDQALEAAGRAVLEAAAPFALAALLAGAAAVLAQTGWPESLHRLAPDVSRIDPRKGLGRLLGPATLGAAGKSLAKLLLVGWACWSALAAGGAQGLSGMMDWPPGVLANEATRLILRLLFAVLAAQALIAGIDLLVTRMRHAGRLRMSRQELKDEVKEAEGDPAVRRRLRQIATARARRRIAAMVRKATVVVVNPTHYAVALAYARGSGGAPRVVAKGMDTLAARIRDVAREYRVPVVTNPPLARALWRVELDREIPPEHFKAVAEIISYLWRLRPPPP